MSTPPAAWLTLTKCEARMVVRDTAGLVVPIALPMLVLVMNASAAAGQEVTGGRSALDVHVLPLVFAIVMASIGVINMPSFLAYYRRAGILRRLAVTPVSPLLVLVAQLLVSLAQALVGIGLAFAVAVFAFDAGPPAAAGTAVLAVTLSIVALYAVGMVVASLAPTPNSAVAIGLIAFFLLGAVGGLFGGVDALPDAVARVGSLLPFGATVDALSSAWSGTAIPADTLTALGVTTVAGVTVATVWFRWD